MDLLTKIAIFLIFSVIFRESAANHNGNHTDSKCLSVLKEAGASDHFATHVGHSIHYITVEDLQRFNDSVSADNKIPTVNKNLTSNVTILDSAPHRSPSSRKFLTQAMQATDEVLNRIGQEWDVAKHNIDQHLIHALRMIEHWEHVRKVYESLKTHPVPHEACKCVIDVDHNGIKKFLQILALAIRQTMNTGLPQTQPYLSRFWDKMKRRFKSYRRKPQVQPYYSSQKSAVNVNITDQELIKSNSTDLIQRVGTVPWIRAQPQMRTRADWKEWKENAMQMNNDIAFKDVALYLHCALRG